MYDLRDVGLTARPVNYFRSLCLKKKNCGQFDHPPAQGRCRMEKKKIILWNIKFDNYQYFPQVCSSVVNYTRFTFPNHYYIASTSHFFLVLFYFFDIVLYRCITRIDDPLRDRNGTVLLLLLLRWNEKQNIFHCFGTCIYLWILLLWKLIFLAKAATFGNF